MGKNIGAFLIQQCLAAWRLLLKVIDNYGRVLTVAVPLAGAALFVALKKVWVEAIGSWTTSHAGVVKWLMVCLAVVIIELTAYGAWRERAEAASAARDESSITASELEALRNQAPTGRLRAKFDIDQSGLRIINDTAVDVFSGYYDLSEPSRVHKDLRRCLVEKAGRDRAQDYPYGHYICVPVDANRSMAKFTVRTYWKVSPTAEDWQQRDWTFDTW